MSTPKETTMDKAMKDALIERVARSIDPEAWSAALPVPTRFDTEAFHARRQASTRKAACVVDLVEAAMRWKEARETSYEVKPPEVLHRAEYDAAEDMRVALNRMKEESND